MNIDQYIDGELDGAVTLYRTDIRLIQDDLDEAINYIQYMQSAANRPLGDYAIGRLKRVSDALKQHKNAPANGVGQK